jgi:hypothetical protein
MQWKKSIMLSLPGGPSSIALNSGFVIEALSIALVNT